MGPIKTGWEPKLVLGPGFLTLTEPVIDWYSRNNSHRLHVLTSSLAELKVSAITVPMSRVIGVGSQHRVLLCIERTGKKKWAEVSIRIDFSAWFPTCCKCLELGLKLEGFQHGAGLASSHVPHSVWSRGLLRTRTSCCRLPVLSRQVNFPVNEVQRCTPVILEVLGAWAEGLPWDRGEHRPHSKQGKGQPEPVRPCLETSKGKQKRKGRSES